MTVRLHLITRYTYIFSYQCYRSIPLSHNEETTIEQANEMSRFNRGARRIIDENGRFTRVSMDDYATLRSKAESVARSELGSPSRSPGTGSETGTEPFGWRPGTTDEGSVVDGSEAEEDPTSKTPKAPRPHSSKSCQPAPRPCIAAETSFIDPRVFFNGQITLRASLGLCPALYNYIINLTVNRMCQPLSVCTSYIHIARVASPCEHPCMHRSHVHTRCANCAQMFAHE